MTYEVIGTRNFLPLRGDGPKFYSVGVGGEYDQPGGGDVGVYCSDEETAQIVASALNLYQEMKALRGASNEHAWIFPTSVALLKLCEVMDGVLEPTPIDHPPLIANDP